jgi:hypothetical protein
MNNTIQNLIDDLVMHDINYIGSSPYNDIISPINIQTTLNPKYVYTVFKSNNNYYIITNTNIITPYGVVNTIIGGDYNNRGIIDGTGQSAKLFSPFGLCKYNNNIYFCEASNLVRIANNNYTTQKIAGLNNEFLNPYNMIISNNFMYLTDTDNSAVQKINLSNYNIETIKGQFKSPKGITIDNNNIIYISDLYDNSIYQIYPNNISKIFVKDGLNIPICLSCDSNNNIYVVEYYGKIKKITNNSHNDNNNYCLENDLQNININTIAGNDTIKSIDGNGTNASFHFPQSITIDSSNNIYIGEWFKIRKIDTNMNVTTIVGGNYNYYSNNLTNSYFNVISGLVYNDNKLYISDSNNNNIRTFSFDKKYEQTIQNIYEMSTGTLYKIFEAIYKYIENLLNQCLDKINILFNRLENLKYKIESYDEYNHKYVLDQIVLKPIDIINIQKTININNNIIYDYDIIDISANVINTYVIYNNLIFNILNNVDTITVKKLSEYGNPIKMDSYKTTINNTDIIRKNVITNYPINSFTINNVILMNNPITITNYIISIRNLQSNYLSVENPPINIIMIDKYLYNNLQNNLQSNSLQSNILYYYYDKITNTNYIQKYDNNLSLLSNYPYDDFINDYNITNLGSYNIIVFNNMMVKLIIPSQQNSILSFDPTPIYLLETLYLIDNILQSNNNIIINVTKKSQVKLNDHAEYTILTNKYNNYYLDSYNRYIYYYTDNTRYAIKETDTSKYFINKINQIGYISLQDKFTLDYNKLFVIKINDKYKIYSNNYSNLTNTSFIIKDNDINIYFNTDNNGDFISYIENGMYKIDQTLYKLTKISYNNELNEFINLGYKITETENIYYYYLDILTNKLYSIDYNIITNKQLALHIYNGLNNEYKVYNINASGVASLVYNTITNNIYIIDNKYIYYDNTIINNIIYNDIITIGKTSKLINVNNLQNSNIITNYKLNAHKVTLLYNKGKEYKLLKADNDGNIIYPTESTFMYSRYIINNKAYILNNYEDIELYTLSSYILMNVESNSKVYVSKNIAGIINNSNMIINNPLVNHIIIYIDNLKYIYLLETSDYNNMITYQINPTDDIFQNIEYCELYKYNNDGTVSLYNNENIYALTFNNNSQNSILLYKNNQPIQNQLINYKGNVVYTDEHGYIHVLENDSHVAFKNYILNNNNYNYVLTRYDLSNNIFETDNINNIYYMYNSKIYKTESTSGFNSGIKFTDIYFVILYSNLQNIKLYYNELEYNVMEGTMVYAESSDNSNSIYNGLYFYGASHDSSIIKWRWTSLQN